MKNIADIDPNFKPGEQIDKAGMVFYHGEEEPFRIYGVFKENGRFRRLPEAVAKTVSENVLGLHDNTAGGRLRFRTDSSRVALSAKMQPEKVLVPVANFYGMAGFDIYADNEYVRTILTDVEKLPEGYEGVTPFAEKKMREITIHFPSYAWVEDVYIGLDEDAKLEAPEPYRNEKPVVYYGSSITQGGCASRPGNIYQNIVARRFHCDYINLGFSGSAKAEDEIAEYIKELPMSLFVYDYDHNAPTAEHLAKTHERMFQIVRKANPELPIIMMARPKYYLNQEEEERRKIIEQTYQNAISAGDQNVYYISSRELMEYCGNNGTIENTHPNDYGFFSMAKALGDLIEKHRLL